jgi:predicted signal transduction protein with EAL and GGDEF domain
MARDEWPAVRALATGRSLHGQAMGVLGPGQPLRWLLVNAELIRDASGRVSGTATCFTDVTEQRNQQAVLGHTVEAAGLGTWQWDMRSGAMHFNDRLLTMLGWCPGDLAPTMDAWSALVQPDDRAAWQAALRAHLDNPTVPCRVELRVRRPDGDWAAVLSCGLVIERDAAGTAQRMAGINIDMTEQRQMQAMLRHAARTDGLTQLPNRAAVFDHVQQVLDRAQREPGFGYAVLFMDFDRFKQVNDTLGHGAGDELLRQIAQRLRGALRAGDEVRPGAVHGPMHGPKPGPGLAQQAALHTAGRIGGDEFVVVLEGVRGREQACAIARRLMDVLAQPYAIGQQLVHSSASVGIVTSELPANDARVVMRDADTAMYEAKRAGRDRYVVFDPSMHERVAHSVETERDLRAALQRDELFVVYQPVVELQRAGPGGVEALVRWQHPSRGLVPPLDFIGVAEESGLIVELGRFVLDTACRQFMAWQRALGPLAPTSVAVNLSPMQLRSTALVADVQRCLQASGIAPAALQLEVTETLAAQDDAARAKLRALKALGVRIALDDFGTGYSSLACLHQLPVDTVKIDRSFVMHADSSDYHRVLIEATIRVAQTLGMGTVAEGIETPLQSALMRRLHCDRGQGYLFSKPLDAQALQAWMLQRPDQHLIEAA